MCSFAKAVIFIVFFHGVLLQGTLFSMPTDSAHLLRSLKTPFDVRTLSALRPEQRQWLQDIRYYAAFSPLETQRSLFNHGVGALHRASWRYQQQAGSSRSNRAADLAAELQQEIQQTWNLPIDYGLINWINVIRSNDASSKWLKRMIARKVHLRDGYRLQRLDWMFEIPRLFDDWGIDIRMGQHDGLPDLAVASLRQAEQIFDEISQLNMGWNNHVWAFCEARSFLTRTWSYSKQFEHKQVLGRALITPKTGEETFDLLYRIPRAGRIDANIAIPVRIHEFLYLAAEENTRIAIDPATSDGPCPVRQLVEAVAPQGQLTLLDAQDSFLFPDEANHRIAKAAEALFLTSNAAALEHQVLETTEQLIQSATIP